MRKLFTVSNCIIIVMAFISGFLISQYENRYGILTVAERNVEKKDVQSEYSAGVQDGKININTATEEELDTLNGIGQKLAKRIIEYRQDKGYFNTCEDLMKVSGIGESLYRTIENKICIN